MKRILNIATLTISKALFVTFVSYCNFQNVSVNHKMQEANGIVWNDAKGMFY